jgi:hypothetical protein
VGKFQPNLKEQKPVLKSGQKRHFDPLVGDIKKETTKRYEDVFLISIQFSFSKANIIF